MALPCSEGARAYAPEPRLSEVGAKLLKRCNSVNELDAVRVQFTCASTRVRDSRIPAARGSTLAA